MKFVSVFIVGATVCVASQILYLKQHPNSTHETTRPKEEMAMYEIKEGLVFEYGETLSEKITTYVLLEDTSMLEKMHMTLDVSKNADGYVDVGTYQGEVIYKDTKKTFTFEIKDTIHPVFTQFATVVELPINSKEDNVLAHFKAEDISGIAYMQIKGTYNLCANGVYHVQIEAMDAHGNVTYKDVEIRVYTNISNTQKPQEEKPEENNTMEKPEENVCAVGVANPDEVGNSGLVFYGDEAYYKWENEFLFSDEYWQGNGYKSYLINYDACGNIITNQKVWTVEWL